MVHCIDCPNSVQFQNKNEYNCFTSFSANLLRLVVAGSVITESLGPARGQNQISARRDLQAGTDCLEVGRHGQVWQDQVFQFLTRYFSACHEQLWH